MNNIMYLCRNSLIDRNGICDLKILRKLQGYRCIGISINPNYQNCKFFNQSIGMLMISNQTKLWFASLRYRKNKNN